MARILINEIRVIRDVFRNTPEVRIPWMYWGLPIMIYFFFISNIGGM